MSNHSPTSSLWEDDRYENVLYSGCSGFGMGLIHRHLERSFKRTDYFKLCVEVGAGAGQHQPYVRHQYDQYINFDLRRPIDYPDGKSFIQADTESMPFKENSIDRLISTCVLHHLANPEVAMEEWRRVTKPGGRVSFILATDPGFLHRLARRVSTARIQNDHYDHNLEMAREHRNHAWALEKQIGHVFKHDRVRVSGLPLPWFTWNFNISLVINIVKQP